MFCQASFYMFCYQRHTKVGPSYLFTNQREMSCHSKIHYIINFFHSFFFGLLARCLLVPIMSAILWSKLSSETNLWRLISLWSDVGLICILKSGCLSESEQWHLAQKIHGTAHLYVLTSIGLLGNEAWLTQGQCDVYFKLNHCHYFHPTNRPNSDDL